jgi:hypothetical protein
MKGPSRRVRSKYEERGQRGDAACRSYVRIDGLWRHCPRAPAIKFAGLAAFWRGEKREEEEERRASYRINHGRL